NRANINHIPRKIVINRLLYIGRYFGMIATVQYTMVAVIGDLVGSKNTTVAQDAARHVQLYFVANVYLFKSTAVKLVAGFGSAVVKAKVLQVALASLVANRAIQRVVYQKHLHHAFTRLNHFR